MKKKMPGRNVVDGYLEAAEERLHEKPEEREIISALSELVTLAKIQDMMMLLLGMSSTESRQDIFQYVPGGHTVQRADGLWRVRRAGEMGTEAISDPYTAARFTVTGRYF